MTSKLTFHVPKMDCPAEEQLVRMKLADQAGIQTLHFDLPSRTLVVCHTGTADPIVSRLEELNLGATVVGSESVEDTHAEPPASNIQRRVLWQVFTINLGFFFIESIAGVLARSVGLLADSLDMLADAIVYGLSLYVVGRSTSAKQRIASLCGYFQLALAILGFAEVARRVFGYEAMPGVQTMIVISVLALIGNAISLLLLQMARSTEVHIRASMIFTSSDVIANLGVIAAAALVHMTQSKIPDLVVGAAVFILVTIGAIRILKLSR